MDPSTHRKLNFTPQSNQILNFSTKPRNYPRSETTLSNLQTNQHRKKLLANTLKRAIDRGCRYYSRTRVALAVWPGRRYAARTHLRNCTGHNHMRIRSHTHAIVASVRRVVSRLVARALDREIILRIWKPVRYSPTPFPPPWRPPPSRFYPMVERLQWSVMIRRRCDARRTVLFLQSAMTG